MNTPTSSAPHICRNVLAKTPDSSWPQFGLTVTATKARIRSQEARIDVPAMKGAQLKATDPAFPVIEDVKAAFSARGMILGSGDQGPVQSATTMTRIPKGARPSQTSLVAAGCGVEPPPTGKGC